MLLGLSALISATLFTGVALYISFVEHPARLRLSDAALLAQWQPSYKAALPIQAGLAVVSGALGLLVWFGTGEWPWLIGSIAILGNWPFTMFAIMPLNKQLLAMKPSAAGAETRAMLLRWGKLHDVRGALGSAALLLYAYVLAAG